MQRRCEGHHGLRLRGLKTVAIDLLQRRACQLRLMQNFLGLPNPIHLLPCRSHELRTLCLHYLGAHAGSAAPDVPDDRFHRGR